MEIALATDHAGYDLKETIKENLKNRDMIIKDFGALKKDPSDDYPDFIIPAAKYVASNKNVKGIILGGSGQGEAMAANRVKGIRAAVYYDGPKDIILLSRLHNDANILSLGARFITSEKAIEVINIWLETSFEGDRHKRRIKKLDKNI
tara:strand:+ start:146 stop:589 length:444 start_codon:yes stop_codon:yes gene_type:complete